MKFNERNRERISAKSYISCDEQERRQWEEREFCKAKWKEERKTLGVLVEESHWLESGGKLHEIIEEYY